MEKKLTIEDFEFEGKKVHIRPDGSGSWEIMIGGRNIANVCEEAKITITGKLGGIAEIELKLSEVVENGKA